jgi:hypothetical protein
MTTLYYGLNPEPANFMRRQFPTAAAARDWLLRRAWVLEQIGEAGRAWRYRRAAGLLARRP